MPFHVYYERAQRKCLILYKYLAMMALHNCYSFNFQIFQSFLHHQMNAGELDPHSSKSGYLLHLCHLQAAASLQVIFKSSFVTVIRLSSRAIRIKRFSVFRNFLFFGFSFH